MTFLRRAGAWVREADRFVRLHLLFFTAAWTLLGAASVTRRLSAFELTVILAVTLCFHVYAYVLNDVIDLAIDRHQPPRQRDPLVRGAIRPSQALLFALIQPLLTIPLTNSLSGTSAAHATLMSGFALMGAYDVWGKRCPIPPLTDLIQGLAWGSLVVYAAHALGETPGPLTWMVAGYATVYVVFINGIHGSLRDLKNDGVHGARTTATFFGARVSVAGGGLDVPTSMKLYAWLILAVLVIMNVVLMVRNDFAYEQPSWTITTVVIGIFNLAALMLQPQVVWPRGAGADVAWRLQLYLMMMSLPVAFAAHAGLEILVSIALLTVLGLALFDATGPVIRWAWVTLRAAASAASPKQYGVRAARTE